MHRTCPTRSILFILSLLLKFRNHIQQSRNKCLFYDYNGFLFLKSGGGGLQTYSVTVIKCSDESYLRKKGIVSVHSSRVQYVMVGNSRQQKRFEVTGHITTVIRNQRAMNACSCLVHSPFGTIQELHPWNGSISTAQNVHLTSINLIKTIVHRLSPRLTLIQIISYRCAQGLSLQMILTSVKLTINTNITEGRHLHAPYTGPANQEYKTILTRFKKKVH